MTPRASPRRRTGSAGRGAPLLAIMVVLVAAGALGPGFAPVRAGPVGRSSGAGLLLNANPSRGVAPLLVDFSLATPNGTAPRYEWSFGDGQYLNGSGASYSNPSHTYLVPGVYDAVATAVWPAGPENASLTIVVLSPVLSVQLVASPLNGTVPLTVTFNATPSGGSGTYLSYLWSFGDGGVGSGLDIRYTYVTTGVFQAQITVTDSTGANATAEANVTVTAAGATGGGNSSTRNGTPDGAGSGGSSGALSYLPDIGLGLLGAGAAVFVAAGTWVLYRRRAEADEPGPTEGPVPSPPTPAGSVTAAAHVAVGAPEGATSPSPPPASAEALPLSEPSGLAASRRLALQLLRNMGTLPRVAPGELPGPEWTQAGLARSVGAGQSAISRVLRRLAAAGIVEVETAHVSGGGRRVRVYRLTPRGERLARALVETGRTDGDGRFSGRGNRP